MQPAGLRVLLNHIEKVTKSLTFQVPLGILDINENSTQGITEILRELHKRVPETFKDTNVKVTLSSYH